MYCHSSSHFIYIEDIRQVFTDECGAGVTDSGETSVDFPCTDLFERFSVGHFSSCLEFPSGLRSV